MWETRAWRPRQALLATVPPGFAWLLGSMLAATLAVRWLRHRFLARHGGIYVAPPESRASVSRGTSELSPLWGRSERRDSRHEMPPRDGVGPAMSMDSALSFAKARPSAPSVGLGWRRHAGCEE